jgi:hypothetical protein
MHWDLHIRLNTLHFVTWAVGLKLLCALCVPRLCVQVMPSWFTTSDHMMIFLVQLGGHCVSEVANKLDSQYTKLLQSLNVGIIIIQLLLNSVRV